MQHEALSVEHYTNPLSIPVYDWIRNLSYIEFTLKTTDQGRKTNLQLLHKPVVASFFKLPTDCKVMKVMGAFVAFRKSPQFLQLFLADSPASFAKEVILK